MENPSYMASQETPGLEHILKNTEFENTQQSKAIETEKELIRAYRSRLAEQQQETQRLEQATPDLDQQAKRLHKQFRLNRENYDSLKHTSTVLVEHEDALTSKLRATQLTVGKEREKQTAALQKYEGVWASYQGQYDGMEQARQLAEEREELQQLHQQYTNLDNQIQELEDSLSSLQQSNGGDPMKSWVIQMAELYVASQSCASEVETADQIAASLEDEINEVTKKINEAKALLKEQEATHVDEPTPPGSNPNSQEHNNRSTFHPPALAPTPRAPPAAQAGRRTFSLPRLPSRPPPNTASAAGSTVSPVAGPTRTGKPPTNTDRLMGGGGGTGVAESGGRPLMLQVPQLKMPERNSSHIEPPTSRQAQSLAAIPQSRIAKKPISTSSTFNRTSAKVNPPQIQMPILQTPSRQQQQQLQQPPNTLQPRTRSPQQTTARASTSTTAATAGSVLQFSGLQLQPPSGPTAGTVAALQAPPVRKEQHNQLLQISHGVAEKTLLMERSHEDRPLDAGKSPGRVIDQSSSDEYHYTTTGQLYDPAAVEEGGYAGDMPFQTSQQSHEGAMMFSDNNLAPPDSGYFDGGFGIATAGDQFGGQFGFGGNEENNTAASFEDNFLFQGSSSQSQQSNNGFTFSFGGDSSATGGSFLFP